MDKLSTNILDKSSLATQDKFIPKQSYEIVPNYKEKIKETNYEYKEGDIQVYDNKINGNIINNIYRLCINETIIWNRSGSIPSKNKLSFFTCDTYNNPYFHALFNDVIIPNIMYKDKDKLRICRSYINLHLPGFPGDWHIDGPGLGPTIIVYINIKWDTLWEGQTAFYTNFEKKEIKYVDFIPGRITLFEPNIMHRACDLSNFATIECVRRYTLAFHTYFE
jgi:hypothetical protein